jgi:hypothetical protein
MVVAIVITIFLVTQGILTYSLCVCGTKNDKYLEETSHILIDDEQEQWIKEHCRRN